MRIVTILTTSAVAALALAASAPAADRVVCTPDGCFFVRRPPAAMIAWRPPPAILHDAVANALHGNAPVRNAVRRFMEARPLRRLIVLLLCRHRR